MSLARLIRAGLPVPGGFHITTEAYRQFVAANGIQPRILAALARLDPSDLTALEPVSQAIGRFFAEGTLPAEIAEAITAAYAALPHPVPSPSGRGARGEGVAVAVRSSATAEDLPGASFAGQQETYLNIRGAEAVLDAVKRCWASLWTARAMAYRARQGIGPESVALAVVVQELVFADAAGVLFTVNPVSGSRAELMITATWGLGEALVSGAVTPDTLTVTKATGKVIRRETPEKQVMTVRTGTGTREVPVPNSQKKKAVLTDRQAAELAALGRQIEQLYEMPMDIEWTWTAPSPFGRRAGGEGGFAIVQARPITVLPACPIEGGEPPLEWPLPVEKAVLARGSFAEFVPEPVSPLFATLAVPIARQATIKLMNSMGVAGENSYVFAVINHYVYVGMMFTPQMSWQMTKASFAMLGPMVKTAEKRAVAAREKFVDVVQTWQPREPEKLTPSELLAGARELFSMTAEYYSMAQSATIPLSMISEATFGAFYKALVKRRSDPETTVFVFGSENQALRTEKAFYDLALWAKEQPGLADYLARTPAEMIVEALRTGLPSQPALADFSARFDTTLREYGHAIYDLDFAKPVPAESPATLLETLKVYLSGKNNPYERQRLALERREGAEQTILARLDPWRRKYFLQLLRWAQRTAPLREDSIADLGLGHPQIRRLLGEFGRRLAAGGAVAAADDIYWLEAAELEQLARQLENGEALPSLAAQVESRRAKWQAMRRITPPNTLPEKTWMSKFYADNAQTGNVIKGFGASAGRVTARACVLLGPEDFCKLQAGDVLVAGITTPAWTPLFARAAAIVTDIGGPLSHSSIVAREYGLPAVLATGVGTRRIQDGQIVTVDGNAGTVTLHETPAGSKPGDALDWTPPKANGVYMRGSVVDLLPNPVSPLFASIGIPGVVAGVRRVGAVLTRSQPILPDDYFLTLNGYAYMNVAFPARSWGWILTRMLPAYPHMFRVMLPYWREEVLPHYRAVVARGQALALEQLSAAELWREARQVLEAALDYVATLLFATMGAAAGGEALLTQLYNKLVKRAGDPEANVLVMGWDNIPARAEKSLYDLAVWCRERPALAAFILAAPDEALVTGLNAPVPGGVDPADWEGLRQRFAAHLDRFGHLVYELDFARALPLDQPAPLFETIKMYLRGAGVNPYERQRASEARRIQTAETMLTRLKGPVRWAFRKSLNWAQSLAEVREDALAEIGLGYPLLRRLLRELGRRLVQAGALLEPDDIFWLEAGEIEKRIADLQAGEIVGALSRPIAARKAAWEAASQVTPPPMIPYKKKYLGFNTDIWVASGENDGAASLKGVAASAGKVTARARVVHGPEDFGLMRPGEVLVAGATTPAWTPLFAMASAVVTDIGGPLSHGSIVAREYGIPAVMGTGVATRRIHDGQLITVDGGAGTVTLEPIDETEHAPFVV
jgi:pyruvate,water dikinase